MESSLFGYNIYIYISLLLFERGNSPGNGVMSYVWHEFLHVEIHSVLSAGGSAGRADGPPPENQFELPGSDAWVTSTSISYININVNMEANKARVTNNSR